MEQPTLSAQEAADMLDISLATLYAYVSRGLIHSETHPDDSRQRRYSAADVDTLLQRKSARRDPSTAARDSLRWGMPVLDSALTLIRDNNLYYRGIDVRELAQSQSLEAVASLLWTGDLESDLFQTKNRLDITLPDLTQMPPLGRMTVALAIAGATDLRGYDLRAESMAAAGVRILRLLADTVAEPSDDDNIATQLAQAWTPDHPENADLLNMAMVLCADHELNASSFTARVVASAGATPYAVTNAGLAALSGVKHGGMTGRVEALLREIEIVGNPQQVMAERLQRGEIVPGFGHRLYPEGDPRGAVLIKQALMHDQTGSSDLIHATLTAGHDLLGEEPTIDFGLCALSRVLGLSAGMTAGTPSGTPLILFALGRTVGWIAHAIEQAEADTLIRPRARYTGVTPQ